MRPWFKPHHGLFVKEVTAFGNAFKQLPFEWNLVDKTIQKPPNFVLARSHKAL